MYIGSGWAFDFPVTGLFAEYDYAHVTGWDSFGCRRTGYHWYFHHHSYNYPAYLLGGGWADVGSATGCFAADDYGDEPYWNTIGCLSESNVVIMTTTEEVRIKG